MKIPLKLITSIGTSILFFISSSTKVQAERTVSSELLQIVKLSEQIDCFADANKIDKRVSIPTLNGHNRPGCILFEAAVDIDSGSSLKTWNWHEGVNTKKYVSGKLKKNQKVYVIQSNNKIGKQPAVLVGIPKPGATEPERFATVELRYLRYLK